MKKILSILLIAAATLPITASAQTKWHSADGLPLIGKAVDDASTSNRYQRIPDSLLHTVRNGALAGLGRNSAGMALRFAAKTGKVNVKWHSPFKTLMNHQTPTGSRGLDLYTLMPDGTWTFVNSARPNVNSHDSEANVISNMTPVMREYLLYLPLYDGVDSLYIGLDEDAELLQPSDVFHAEKPIIMYGTSILQGGCANRAGMAHTNILARRLNREVINLGFSGNGQLDLEIARVIAAVPDPGLIVLDFVPNVNEEQIDTLMIPFFEIIRSAHPDVPFLFIEDPNFPHKRFDHAARTQVDPRNAMMKERYEKLAAKYGILHYL
ncbi:MAG: SGNH/GDSL hydrolase family protein, partial [Muribaculaceae bacterium]|nr:SGNH/GDSL hydrolase family protein [Muribaculaceae bacterium]